MIEENQEENKSKENETCIFINQEENKSKERIKLVSQIEI